MCITLQRDRDHENLISVLKLGAVICLMSLLVFERVRLLDSRTDGRTDGNTFSAMKNYTVSHLPVSVVLAPIIVVRRPNYSPDCITSAGVVT